MNRLVRDILMSGNMLRKSFILDLFCCSSYCRYLLIAFKFLQNQFDQLESMQSTKFIELMEQQSDSTDSKWLYWLHWNQRNDKIIESAVSPFEFIIQPKLEFCVLFTSKVVSCAKYKFINEENAIFCSSSKCAEKDSSKIFIYIRIRVRYLLNC